MADIQDFNRGDRLQRLLGKMKQSVDCLLTMQPNLLSNDLKGNMTSCFPSYDGRDNTNTGIKRVSGTTWTLAGRGNTSKHEDRERDKGRADFQQDSDRPNQELLTPNRGAASVSLSGHELTLTDYRTCFSALLLLSNC